MRNISPEDAKTTSEVLDRVLKIRVDSHVPPCTSIPSLEYCISTLKYILARYQPSSTAFGPLSILEGKRSKGGRNSFPSTPRPEPPKAQSVK